MKPQSKPQPIRPEEIRYARDAQVRQEVERIYEHGFDPGISVGWPRFDQYWKLRHSEWTLVTGMPSSGKSQWLDNVLVNTMRDHGLRWGIFSAENQPVARHLSHLAEIYSGEPIRHGPTERLSESGLQMALSFLDLHAFWIEPNEENRTVGRLLELADYLVRAESIDALLIDPWNELEHRRPAGQSETEFISQALTKIRLFARERRIHVVLIAHPAKIAKDGRGKYPVPKPYDVSGSSHWYNKADYCITVYRDLEADDNFTWVYTQKIRYREVGKLGSMAFRFNPVNGRYSDPGRNAEPFGGQF